MKRTTNAFLLAAGCAALRLGSGTTTGPAAGMTVPPRLPLADPRTAPLPAALVLPDDGVARPGLFRAAAAPTAPSPAATLDAPPVVRSALLQRREFVGAGIARPRPNEAPVPSAFWTGLSVLTGLGLLSSRKRLRRLLD